MGWEVRHGTRCYLYRNRRANGRPVKTYLGADDDFTRLVLARDLDRLRQLKAEWRMTVRVAWANERARLDALTAPIDDADRVLRAAGCALLLAAGYHRPNRGRWRKRRGDDMSNTLRDIRKQLEAVRGQVAALKPAPLIVFQASPSDAAMVEACRAARAGDPAALARLPDLIAGRGWADGAGDLGAQATARVIDRAAGGDPVWKEATSQHAAGLYRSLAGPDPNPLDKILARRVVNGWVAVHALEFEQAVRPPTDPRSASYLDRRLTQTQRRLTDAARALAAVRRLGVTVQVNIADRQVNVAGRTDRLPAASGTG